MVLVEPLQQKIVGDPSEAPKPLTEKLVFVPTWVSPIVEGRYLVQAAGVGCRDRRGVRAGGLGFKW